MCHRRGCRDAVLGFLSLVIVLGGFIDPAVAADKSTAKKKRYELELAFVSFATSFGGYIPLGAPRRKGAFAFDLDAGARPIFRLRAGSKTNPFGTLAIWPVVGYSHVILAGSPMHLFSAGVGFGFGQKALFAERYYFTARVVTGDVGGAHLTGGRFDVQLSLFHVLGFSLGYQGLTGVETHHALRLMVMLDVGSFVTLILLLK